VSADSEAVARQFFAAWEAHDLEAVAALVQPSAPVRIVPASLTGTFEAEGRAFVGATSDAFPDLRWDVLEVFHSAERVVARVTLEGTQAAPYLGVINQEKHLDIEQVWLLDIEAGSITGLTAYWCQNQLYRRLAVKRLDQLSIIPESVR